MLSVIYLNRKWWLRLHDELAGPYLDRQAAEEALREERLMLAEAEKQIDGYWIAVVVEDHWTLLSYWRMIEEWDEAFKEKD